MTISIDEAVYEGLVRFVGRRKISRFLEYLARPHVVKDNQEAGYEAMANDQRRECEACEWSEGLIGDVADAAMQSVSLFDTKTHLSRRVDQIASGAENEIVISRNGKPVARVVPLATDVSCRVGLARGEFEVPDDIDRSNAEVAALFMDGR
ncbi:MAG: hypothetical protein WAZ34_16870 [Rhodocyclaceae bacterium]